MFFTVSIKSRHSQSYLAVFNSKDEALNNAMELLEKHFATDDTFIDDGNYDASSEADKILIGGPYKEGTNLLVQRDQKRLSSFLEDQD